MSFQGCLACDFQQLVIESWLECVGVFGLAILHNQAGDKSWRLKRLKVILLTCNCSVQIQCPCTVYLAQGRRRVKLNALSHWSEDKARGCLHCIPCFEIMSLEEGEKAKFLPDQRLPLCVES